MHNALTVMLYMVGTDLERTQLNESGCLLEIMEGISAFEGSRGISQADVHFLVQTGGSLFVSGPAVYSYNVRTWRRPAMGLR